MRKNILATIYAFVAGIPHTEGSCSTDGKVLKSYNLIIARKEGDGFILVKEGNHSKTTLIHIRAVHSVLKGKPSPELVEFQKTR